MNIDVNECPIFVSSADSYSDIWETFFALFKREWPQYRGTIYLNTQTLGFQYKGLDIVCTKVGPQKYFGQTFLDGINKIPGEHFLLLMIDYFFESSVNMLVLQGIYEDFIKYKPDAVQLMTHPYKNTTPIGDCGHCSRILPPGGLKSAWFSFQAAFWNKSAIWKYIKTWESPWTAEYFGTKRAEILNPDIWTVDIKPIPYDAAGVLYGGGKWNKKALEKIDFTEMPMPDWNTRDTFRKLDAVINLQRIRRLLNGNAIRSMLDVRKLRKMYESSGR